MLVKPAPRFIDVPVRPLFFGGLWFLREQRETGFSKRTDHVTGDTTVTLDVYVEHFHVLPDGSKGRSAQELIPKHLHVLNFVADNTEAVNLATGEVITERQNGRLREEWEAFLEALPGQFMLRGTAFIEQMHSEQGVKLVPQMRDAMIDADTERWGRFGNGPLTVPTPDA